MSKGEEKKNIIKEINKTGFPLELRVSKFLTDNEYLIANNLYYIDQDEGKGREIDMRALKNYEFRAGGKEYFIRNCLLIECKKSAEKPWVVFTSSQTIYDGLLFFLHSRGVRKDIKWKDYNVPKKMDKLHPFSLCERRGRTFFEPFTNFQGESIYKSLITSVKAAIAMRDIEFAAKSNDVCFYYPTVIFDGKLYEAYLNEKNKIEAQEADFVIVSFFYQSLRYQDERFIVPIVTERYLPTFSSQLDSVLHFFGKLFKDNLDLIEISQTKKLFEH